MTVAELRTELDAIVEKYGAHAEVAFVSVAANESPAPEDELSHVVFDRHGRSDTSSVVWLLFS